MTLYDVWVQGDPKGQPRPRAFSRGGHARVYDPGTAEGWKQTIALKFNMVTAPIEGPVRVELAFYLPRPKGHYGSGKNALALKTLAPTWHIAKPDTDNLAKAVLDVLTTLRAWHDDSQVASMGVTKRYAMPLQGPGCRITVETLEPPA
jgi:Holliday junction resolvase RusA-like endonuclease